VAGRGHRRHGGHSRLAITRVHAAGVSGRSTAPLGSVFSISTLVRTARIGQPKHLSSPPHGTAVTGITAVVTARIAHRAVPVGPWPIPP
jgi:hypothetical protein